MFSPYAFGYLLALFAFAVVLVGVIALVRLLYSRDAAYAKATFRKGWVWAVSVGVIALLALVGSL